MKRLEIMLLSVLPQNEIPEIALFPVKNPSRPADKISMQSNLDNIIDAHSWIRVSLVSLPEHDDERRLETFYLLPEGEPERLKSGIPNPAMILLGTFSEREDEAGKLETRIQEVCSKMGLDRIPGYCAI
jgi:hypothetical protein